MPGAQLHRWPCNRPSLCVPSPLARLQVPLLLATSLVQADKRVLAAALKSLKEHK